MRTKSTTMQLQSIQQELEEAQRVIRTFLEDRRNIEPIQAAGELMVASLQSGGKIISCGNGGSMCDAMHFAEELSGRYRSDRPALAAIAISDPSHLSCTANDYGYEFVFSRFVEAMGREGDVLLAISTSGNSANVVRAAQAAKSRGMKVVALTGKGGGQLAGIADVLIDIPHQGFADRIQEMHIKIIHILIHFIESSLGYK